MKKLAMVATAATLALSASAFAGGPDLQAAPVPPAQNNWYAGLNGGVAIPAGDSGLLNTGFDVGGQVGYKMGNIRLEGALSYLRHSVSSSILPAGFSADFDALALMANGYYDFDMGNSFVPYVGAGIGWLHGWANAAFGGATASAVDNEFAYQGIVGIDYKIDPNMTVGVNYHIVSFTNSGGFIDNIINATFNYYFM